MLFEFYRLILSPLLKWTLILFRSVLSPKMQAVVRLREARPWKQNQLPKNAVVIHASSGEIEYAKPVIRKLKALYPDQKVILTYFSPSILPLISSLQVDASVPLPWDTEKDVSEFLQALRPKALWISRTDLWPELIYQCRIRKISTLLFSASVRPSRFFWQNHFKRWILRLFSEISVIDESDFNFSKQLTGPVVFKDGNTRVDQVFDRLSEQRKLPVDRFNTKPVIVLGSLWMNDIKVWIDVIKDPEIQEKFQWIWVPHEMDPGILNFLKTELSIYSRSVEFWTEVKISKADHLIVDAVGFLAELYQMGQLAFVGGSFHSKVHSLLEPLAAGVPVIVGPNFSNQPEAETFSRMGLPSGIQAVNPLTSSQDIIHWLRQYRPSKDGQLILARLQQDRGASERLLERHLSAHPIKN